MNKACCALPPVSAEYTPKGHYETICGLNTYVISPSANPTRAIIDIYDIFGLAPQTIQGADRLATLTNSLVLVPDWFRGDYCQPRWMGEGASAEDKAALAAFVERQVNFARTVEKLIEVRKEVGNRWREVEGHVGVFGLCFGGKVAVLATGEGNVGVGRRFEVSGTAHPGRLDAKDHETLNVPHICLASPGEPADFVAEVKEILSKPGKTGYVETYETMFHGWMGARANLKDEANLREYERGYNAVADFFNKYL
ncbi:dienelactone hydrolase family protein [Coniochaeta sp. 2T2.1]|nr:dienelactone hydrolase family protein [Coniochaeta sp. 2T2.1]